MPRRVFTQCDEEVMGDRSDFIPQCCTSPDYCFFFGFCLKNEMSKKEP